MLFSDSLFSGLSFTAMLQVFLQLSLPPLCLLLPAAAAAAPQHALVPPSQAHRHLHLPTSSRYITHFLLAVSVTRGFDNCLFVVLKMGPGDQLTQFNQFIDWYHKVHNQLVRVKLLMSSSAIVYYGNAAMQQNKAHTRYSSSQPHVYLTSSPGHLRKPSIVCTSGPIFPNTDRRTYVLGLFCLATITKGITDLAPSRESTALQLLKE